MKKEDFNRPGPQITDTQYGAEPSLAEVIRLYFERSGATFEMSSRMRDRYIREWMRDYAKDIQIAPHQAGPTP